MLIKPSLVTFLVGMVLCAHLRPEEVPQTKTSLKKRKRAETGTGLKDLASLVTPDLELPLVPSTLNKELVIYIRRKSVRDLMRKIFPQYDDVQTQITKIADEMRQDEKKLQDESMRQKIINLSREQNLLEQAELNLVTLATRALVTRLSEVSTEPIVFVVRVVDEERELFPVFDKFPEIKAYQENLSKQFENEFLKIYQGIRNQEEAKRKTQKKKKKKAEAKAETP
jgi:hypothetical protein